MDESREPQEFFAAQYAPMSDKELLDIAVEYDNLVEPAQAAVQDELKEAGARASQAGTGYELWRQIKQGVDADRTRI